MSDFCYWPALCLTGMLFLVPGCSLERNPFGTLADKGGGSFADSQAAARPENTQEAYREALLNGQLQHAQLDLEQAETVEEKASIEARIAAIRRQLEILGASQPRTARRPATVASTDFSIHPPASAALSSHELSETHRQLQQLERELQFTEDPQQQNALAMQIATLRRKLHKAQR